MRQVKKSTLFPTNVAQAAEVTGQSLQDPNVTPWIGPFVVNPAGTKAQAIAVDFVFPAGCFTLNKDTRRIWGIIRRAAWRSIARSMIAGAPIGDFSTLFSTSRIYTASHHSRQRKDPCWGWPLRSPFPSYKCSA